MPKKVFPKASTILPDDPPVPLLPEEEACYRDLVKQVREAGFNDAAGAESLVVTACMKARLEKMRHDVNVLPSFMTFGSTGSEIMHPLVKELRQLEASYHRAIGSLLLTPRSKSTARLKGNVAKADVDPILKAIG